MPEPGNKVACCYKMPEPQGQDDCKDTCQSDKQIAHPILREQDPKVVQGERFGRRCDNGIRKVACDCNEDAVDITELVVEIVIPLAYRHRPYQVGQIDGKGNGSNPGDIAELTTSEP